MIYKHDPNTNTWVELISPKIQVTMMPTFLCYYCGCQQIAYHGNGAYNCRECDKTFLVEGCNESVT